MLSSVILSLLDRRKAPSNGETRGKRRLFPGAEKMFRCHVGGANKPAVVDVRYVIGCSQFPRSLSVCARERRLHGLADVRVVLAPNVKDRRMAATLARGIKDGVGGRNAPVLFEMPE